MGEEVSDTGGHDQEKERLAAKKKRQDAEKRQRKQERQAEERRLEDVAAAAAAEVAAAAAEAQALVDAKAAAVAQVESERLAKIAAKKAKKKKPDDLDDLAILELAFAANNAAGGTEAVVAPAAANKSVSEAERAAQLRGLVKARIQQSQKCRGKTATEKEEPSAEDVVKAAQLATAAEVNKSRNIARQREARQARERERELQAKGCKQKSQPITTSPASLEAEAKRALSSDAEATLRHLELEVSELEADVPDTIKSDKIRVGFSERVTELMIKFDGLRDLATDVSAEVLARRRDAINHLHALAARLDDGPG